MGSMWRDESISRRRDWLGSVSLIGTVGPWRSIQPESLRGLHEGWPASLIFI
jgi:hypothetical protein